MLDILCSPDSTHNSSGQSVAIRKDREFQTFISSLEEGTLAHWQDIARAIGVNKDTIQRWKELPEAKMAMAKGVSYSLKQMENVGRRDWRMWEAKLKLLGVSAKSTAELSITDERQPIPLPSLVDYSKKTEEELTEIIEEGYKRFHDYSDQLSENKS